MFVGTSDASRQMFLGDLLLVGCCVFYLLWWILAFKPTNPIGGMKSGWLLIPAIFLGIAAVALMIRGANGVDASVSFFSGKAVLVGGVVAYVALLLVTGIVFHRQVTTELLLIVGWAALALFEANALYGLGIVTRNGALALFVVAVLFAIVSMVCYVLYFGLSDRLGYVDGMVPLVLVALYMVALAVLIAIAVAHTP